MTELLTSAQMRAIERTAIESGAVTGQTLMERAGAGVLEALLQARPALEEGPVQAVVLCGPGNNGGDGFVIARRMAARGWRVQVFLLGDPRHLPPDALAAFEGWAAQGLVQGYTAPTLVRAASQLVPGWPLVVVDALFGIGLGRPLGPEVTAPWEAFCAAAPAGWIPVAVDVPSGVSDAMPGRARLAGFQGPDLLCVTFHAMKEAHRAMLAAGERVVVADLGLTGAMV